ncbi:ankyrin repeat domain-containing protein [Salinisphaera sp.]|uniref:ankyrin repeat domain-containing protein n=1 Tax=Salinisphaera sp. TaxID=1914330 RepID=UPI002D795A64|nr:ankyrin repeat domain-containing protein [Salinisphaera sp.]HET7315261.1 ankyrin repeat domain-containing protein [Salinisphaera sp.]
MKRCLLVLVLLLSTCLTLSACAATAQALAQMRLNTMQASEYFQKPAEIALVEAASEGDIKGMQQAIAHGADVNAVGKDGMAPLIWTAAIHPNLQGFKYLLAHGADPNLVTDTDEGPGKDLAYIIKVAYLQSDPRFLKALLEAGADPNTVVGETDTLLFFPSLDQRLSQTKLLIKYGANVNYQGPVYGITPIENAIDGRQFKAALLLLRSGADPTLEDSNGDGALTTLKMFRASAKKVAKNELPDGYPELIQALKKRGYLEADF